MNREELIEYLANLEHKRCSNWQTLHDLCIKNEDGSLTIPKKYVDCWNRESALKYRDLPEKIKESYRKEVYKIIFLFDFIVDENKTLQKTLQNSEKNAENLQRELKQKDKVIKEAIDLIHHDYSYDSTAFEDRKFQTDLLKILERTDK